MSRHHLRDIHDSVDQKEEHGTESGASPNGDWGARACSAWFSVRIRRERTESSYPPRHVLAIDAAK